jgi:hypothetical protein
MKRTILKALSVFGAAYAISFVTFSASEADAAWRRIGSQFCKGSSPASTAYQAEYFQNTMSVPTGAFCAVPDDGSLSHGSVTTINIHGSRNPTNHADFANACVKFWSGSGTSCGSATYLPSYHFNSTVDASAWQANPNSFAYLGFSLGSGSAIYGAYVHD